jgi:hypothetical protein
VTVSSIDSAVQGSNTSHNGDGLRPVQRRRWFSWHWSTWIATFIVAWAMWDVQTDSYPATQYSTSSYYVYGWPICFVTSGRGRFNFYRGFNTGFLILDLMVSLVLVACTAFAVETLLRRSPKIKSIDIIGIPSTS